MSKNSKKKSKKSKEKVQKSEATISNPQEYWEDIMSVLGKKNIEELRRLLSQNTGEKIKVVNPKSAGIDVASKEHWVCVPPEFTKENIRQFGTFTCDLHEIAKWLVELGITTVAIESTGVYWIPLFQILEATGIEVCLVNAKHFKNVPGRGKTDRLDCQWLQKLHTFGLLRASFRPNRQICEIRSLLRHRDNIIRQGATHIQHMQKALEQMNIKLGNVISKISGATGIKIIQAIVDGERDFAKLAALKHPGIKASKEEIIKSLQGDYRPEHIFTLKQSLVMYNFVQQQIEECDREIEKYLHRMEQKKQYNQVTFDFVENDETDETDQHRPRKKKAKKNEPRYDAQSYLTGITGVDITETTGISESTALTVISEIGLDMTKWKSEKKFVSWLGVCPKPDKSGGKILGTSTRKVQNRAAVALRMAALSLKNSQSYLGHFFRKIAAKRGFHKAITATARKLAVIIYTMLKNKVPFKELGPDFYLEQNKEKMIQNLIKRASALGCKVVISENVFA